MATEFSRTLSLLRKERGVSQRMAAADLGVSQALLSHYENGIREPGLAFVVQGLRLLSCLRRLYAGPDAGPGRQYADCRRRSSTRRSRAMCCRAACWPPCGASSSPAPAACCSACWASWETRMLSTPRRTVWAATSTCFTGCSTGLPEAALPILLCPRRTALQAPPPPGPLWPGRTTPVRWRNCPVKRPPSRICPMRRLTAPFPAGVRV